MICYKLGISLLLPLFNSGLSIAITIVTTIIIENAASLYIIMLVIKWVTVAFMAGSLQLKRAGQVLRCLIKIILKWTVMMRKTVLLRLQGG